MHNKNRDNNIENNNPQNRVNNIGNIRTNNNINMDNKIKKNINKSRRRNIIGLTQFLANSNINIGKYFLGLINKNFEDDNLQRKIINKNDIKISYSWTNNISKIINNHNKKLINKLDWNNNDKLKHSCNCKIKNECPQGNKYNLHNIIYQAKISTKENDTNEKGVRFF